MEHKINKPRVFLSHSKKDAVFIEKLYNDLRKCQIDPWMDTEEIRDGKSWLKVIFEDGIPTCDVVIIYFTKNSITSKMVGKEIDAALIEQLSEKGITFLPYVEDEELRAKLRSDIRSLHCRLWNETNYLEVIPSVVAEIWHSYLEKIVQLATLQEKNKRLELEIELTRLKEHNLSHIFSPSEDADFQNIYNQLNTQVEIIFDLWEKGHDDKGTGKRIGLETFDFNLYQIITDYAKAGYYYLDHWRVLNRVSTFLKSHGYPNVKTDVERHYGNGHMTADYVVWLKTYGLLKRVQLTDGFGKIGHEEEWTDKIYRFLYWLENNNYMINGIEFEYKGFGQKES